MIDFKDVSKHYGAASDATLLYYLGLACQILAIVALMFVVNWKVIRLYYGEDWKAPAGFMGYSQNVSKLAGFSDRAGEHASIQWRYPRSRQELRFRFFP